MIKIVIDDFLSHEECKGLIAYANGEDYELPTVKTDKGEAVNTSIRNNGRVIIENVEMAENLFNRMKNQLPQNIDEWKLKGLNEQMKIYRYEVGQEFRLHKDVPFIRNDSERSFITMLIYLNEDFKGGETFFLNGEVKPKTGSCLLFQQNVQHAGVVVTEGIKYAIRTDVMYTL